MTTEASAGNYVIEFCCANCGQKFETQIRKGVAATGAAGICPNCGVRDNTPGIGAHKVIRANESEDPTGGRQVLMEPRHF